MSRFVLPEGISLGEFLHDADFAMYDFKVSGGRGEMVTTFRESTRYYTINDLDVVRAHRRQGIGKLLVGTALEHARELQADLLVAAIISRECLDVMTSVLGPDNVSVKNSGGYAPAGEDSNRDRPTMAAVMYHLR